MESYPENDRVHDELSGCRGILIGVALGALSWAVFLFALWKIYQNF